MGSGFTGTILLRTSDSKPKAAQLLGSRMHSPCCGKVTFDGCELHNSMKSAFRWELVVEQWHLEERGNAQKPVQQF